MKPSIIATIRADFLKAKAESPKAIAKRLAKQKRRKKGAEKTKKNRSAVKKHKQERTPAPPPVGIPYAAYLESDWWKFKRRQKLGSVKHTCERCGNRATQVHHRHYRSLRREKNADLEGLCKSCHEREHESLIQAKNHLDSIARQG